MKSLTCSIIGNVNTIKAKNNIRWLQASRFGGRGLHPPNTNTLLIWFHSH